jgi:DinB superfamily
MPTHLDTASELESLIESWRRVLLELGALAASTKPDSDRWSISEVVGHLVDSACNNHQRFVRAQFCSEFVFPKYEPNEWVAAANYRECDWESLVELWYHYNRQIAGLIRNMRTSSLSTPCTIIPYEPCTLGFLVSDYLDHMKHHLNIMADRIEKTKAT